ncbi:hypothetical protein [Planomonospora algeriensis]
MSTKTWSRITVIAAATASLALPSLALPLPGAAQSGPAGQPPGVHDFQAEQHAKPDVDNRRGAVAPPAAALAKKTGATTVRWNALGTPAVVTGPAPLTEGLGDDPEQGNAQAGARVPNVRDNANQITGPDGSPRSRTCTSGSRSRARSTPPAWTATTTCR